MFMERGLTAVVCWWWHNDQCSPPPPTPSFLFFVFLPLVYLSYVIFDSHTVLHYLFVLSFGVIMAFFKGQLTFVWPLDCASEKLDH